MPLVTFKPEFAPIRLSDELLQFGPNPDHRMPTPHAWQRALVEQLSGGIRSDALELAAFASGASREQSARLLRALEPVLHEQDARGVVQVRTESIGAHDDEIEYRVRAAIGTMTTALHLTDTDTATTLVVVTGAVAPTHCARFMRDDREFLPLAFEPGGIRVGPFVRPGKTPCLMCRDLALRDEDAAWPTLQTKMIGRRPALITLDRTSLAVELAHELLAEHAAPEASRWAIVTNARQVIWRQVSWHAQCGCRQP